MPSPAEELDLRLDRRGECMRANLECYLMWFTESKLLVVDDEDCLWKDGSTGRNLARLAEPGYVADE